MRSRTPRHGDSGFSLIELMVVVAILGILVLIAVGSFAYSTRAAARATCEHNRRTFDTAVVIYHNEKEAPPDDIEDLKPYIANYDAAVVCPGDGETMLRYDAPTDSVVCDFHQ